MARPPKVVKETEPLLTLMCSKLLKKLPKKWSTYAVSVALPYSCKIFAQYVWPVLYAYVMWFAASFLFTKSNCIDPLQFVERRSCGLSIRLFAQVLSTLPNEKGISDFLGSMTSA